MDGDVISAPGQIQGHRPSEPLAGARHQSFFHLDPPTLTLGVGINVG
jgi:hypothetical protein